MDGLSADAMRDMRIDLLEQQVSALVPLVQQLIAMNRTLTEILMIASGASETAH